MQSVIDSGIIIVDKPEGLTSARVVSTIKRISGGAKTGHTGTLDPFATGLMICGINNGTRISRFFLGGDKTYIADLFLGCETDTLDRTGTVISQCSENFISDNNDRFTTQAVESLLNSFIGPQEQSPPVYSALKHNGVPLYKLARKGTPVTKPPRPVVIHSLQLLEINLPVIRFEVRCSAGTYIRTLASDIGKQFGCGAHLSALRRTETCGFTLENAVTLNSLETPSDCQAHLIPIAEALPDIPAIEADSDLALRIRHGIPLTVSDIPEIQNNLSSVIKILDSSGKAIAIVEYDKDSQSYNYYCVFHHS